MSEIPAVATGQIAEEAAIQAAQVAIGEGIGRVVIGPALRVIIPRASKFIRFFRGIPKKPVVKPPPGPVPPPVGEPPPAGPPPALPVTAGEPVSVATGEYIETWADFLIQGVPSFDGSRHMGLKLPSAALWRGPLGPCQISTFDEYFANPGRGKLTFHQADGKVIAFDRPFNFLPAENPSYPHLECKRCAGDRSVLN